MFAVKDIYLGRREAEHLQLAAMAASPSAACRHSELVELYGLRAEETQARSQIVTSHAIEERLDNRGISFYVVTQNGTYVTSRWTRIDAEHEQKRLDDLVPIPTKSKL